MTEQRILVGTAGWSYPDWKGIVYPPTMPKGLHPLTYLAAFFDTVEVNSTYYRPAQPQHTEKWLHLVKDHPSFTFTIKLWKRFTHERKTLFAPEEVHLFETGILPLAKARRLGGILVQFPWSFRNNEENRDWLQRVLESFSSYPLVLEVRHASWNVPETYAFLEKHRVSICNIDQPLFSDSISPDSRVTARIGYVRLHGQNFKDWFRQEAGRDERYNYLYSEEELEPWVEKIKGMRASTERIYVITNNHYRGQAAVNALQLAHRLKGKKVKAPESLVRAYPQLKKIARGQGTLFS